MNPQPPPSTCFVVGEGDIPARCLELLRRHGFRILGVFSDDGSLRDVCAQADVPHFASRDALAAALRQTAYDYLFSINNEWVLPADVVATAGRLAINYHDSPLPKYAGLHATSWAIKNGETAHAVSWHEITPTIDGGRIFMQAPVTIEADDTAFNLNTKCAEAAVSALDALVGQLTRGVAVGIEQPREGRTYFGLRDRPDAACAVPFADTASAVNLIRALDFGPSRNPLGLAKVWLGSDWIAVRSARGVRPAGGSGRPAAGTVTLVSREELGVATGDGEIRLSGFRTLAGAPVTVDELVSRYGMAAGAPLPQLTQSEATAVTSFHSRVCGNERAWVHRLLSAAPFAHPYAAGATAAPKRTQLRALAGLAADLPAGNGARRITTLVLAYAARLSVSESFDVGLSTPAQRAPAPAPFASVVPLKLSRVDDETYGEFAARSTTELERAIALGTYALDLAPRYPELRVVGRPHLPFVVVEAESPPRLDIERLDAELAVAVFADGSAPEMVDRVGLSMSQADAIGDQIACLWRESIAAPSCPLVDLPLLEPDERDRILRAWNDTACPFPDQLRIHQLFEQQVEERPTAVALELAGSSWTFAQVEARANRLAHALRARGAAPGSFVGICLERGLELVVTLLGVAKSGAAYVPMEPDYPAERLAFMVEDTQAVLVIVDTTTRSGFAPAVPVLEIDGEHAAAIAQQPAGRPDLVGTSADVCYAIYTSGSTGTPKGVVMTHKAVVNTLDWVTRTFEVGPGDRLLFVTSPCFDLSVYDTFGALGAGATVVIAGVETLMDARVLAAQLVRERISIWDSAPAMLQQLVPFFPAESASAPLRLVMLSGDWIPITLPSTMRTAFARCRVVSLGGATEAAIWSNWFPVDEMDPRWTSVPYGRPIQNARYHVLDSRLHPVPVGVPGDLYIGGVCLAQGYLRRPELTGERFIRDPFSTSGSDERLYRTGDLARYFEDGNLEFLGRRDSQVKVRGFRVELGEVEAALATLPLVREAVCAAHVDAAKQKFLAAYVVPTESGALSEDAIIEALAAKLPDFMVPSMVVLLDALPMSPNGKVDRKALKIPPANQREYVAPRTATERGIADLWAELFQLDRVGLRDSFLALGGHSLLAVTFVGRAQQELGLDISLSQVLEHPVLGTLAAALDRPRGANSRPRHLVTLNPHGSRTRLVLVSGAGGYGFVFQGLARCLGPEQPVHVLNAVGIEDEHEGVSHTIEEIAAIYEPQVLDACGGEPVVLGGYSFGMLVAFELARRLAARGVQIPLLCSLDGFGPGFPRLMPLGQRLRTHLKVLVEQSSEGRVAYLRDRAARVKLRVLGRLGLGHEAFDAPANATPEQQDRLRRVAAGLWRARGLYRPERSPNHTVAADLLLIQTSTATEWIGNVFDDPAYGWGPFIRGRIDVVTVPGEHLHMFDEPQIVDRMARLIAEALARLPATGTRTSTLPARAFTVN